MKINHSELKSIYQRHIKDKKFSSRKNCPSIDEIINLIRSELPRHRKNILLNHIQECPSCIKEAQAIIKILKEEKKFIEKIRELPEYQKNRIKIKKTFSFPFYFSWKSISLFTITLLLIFIVSFSLYTVFNEHKYRGNNQTAIEIMKPKKKIVIYENDIRFKWNEVPGTEFYKIVLFDDSLYPIWESDKLLDNSAKLPFEVQKSMTHKSTYFLLVTSYMKSGKKIESQFKEFKVFIKHAKN